MQGLRLSLEACEKLGVGGRDTKPKPPSIQCEKNVGTKGHVAAQGLCYVGCTPRGRRKEHPSSYGTVMCRFPTSARIHEYEALRRFTVGTVSGFVCPQRYETHRRRDVALGQDKVHMLVPSRDWKL